MQYLACDGSITLDGSGQPLCSGDWVASAGITLAEMTAGDVAALVSAGLVTMCLAYGFRLMRKQMGF